MEDVRPQHIEKGGTATFVARHGEYVTTEGHPRLGHLTEKGYESIKNHAREVFTAMLREIPKDERGNFNILLIASSADRGPDTGQRCIETARAWEEGAIEALTAPEFGLTANQILNPWKKDEDGKEGQESNLDFFSKDGASIGVESDLVGDPYALNEKTKAFMVWLKDECKNNPNEAWLKKYNINRNDQALHFIAYEMDIYKEKRLKMGADGPLEVAERLCKFLTAQQKLAKNFHKKYPERRLAIVNVAHTDNIHPLVKTAMAGNSNEVALEKYTKVQHGGGFSYARHADGTTTKPVIDGREYHIPDCAV